MTQNTTISNATKNNDNIISIGELIKLVEWTSINTKYNEVSLIGMRELSSNYLNCNITPSKVNNKKNTGKVLTEDCLVSGFIGNKFKVGQLRELSVDTPVAIESGIIPFVINSDLITEEFLLRSILSKETEQQAIAMALGTISQRITQDFLSINVIVPSIEEQNRLCKEDTRKYLTDADHKQLESADEFRKDVHMKKHAIGQTIFNLNNWFKLLQQARKEGNGIVDDSATIGKVNKTKVSEIYDNLQLSIAKMQQQISKFDIGYGMQVEETALTEFIEDYISKHQSPMFKFVYDASSHHASRTIPCFECDFEKGEYYETGGNIQEKGDPLEYVNFSKEALSIIFDNIINNACSHGFVGRENSNNYIKIEISDEGCDYIISISNNGNAIHSDLSPGDVFTYGRTSQNNNNHFGIGGYEIRKLMREFNGDAEFISQPEAEFSITYKLKFTDTNIIYA